MTHQRGQFIVVEGLEGAGKTTAMDLIEGLVLGQGQRVIRTREPGGTVVGEMVRTVIKEYATDLPLDPLTELLLLYAARMQLLQQTIRPALEQSTWVLSDRFELSSYAYQGGGRKIARRLIDQLSQACVQSTQADWVVFLDLPPALGLERVLARGAPDRMEREPPSFFQAVYEAYHQQLREMKNVLMIDASQPLVHVQESIRQGFHQRFQTS